MIKIEDGNIYLTRGDSATLNVIITDQAGQTWTPGTGDKVIFCIKSGATTPEPLLTIQAAEGETNININPQDTIGLTFGSYIYDIHVELSGGGIYTVIADKRFEVGREAHTSWSLMDRSRTADH